MRLERFRYHLQFLTTGLTAAAWLLAGGLLAAACNMERWGFVEEQDIHHIAILYENGFSLAAVFLFAPLFAEETDEGILGWLPALPFCRWCWMLERWLTGMLMLAVMYFGSLGMVDRLAADVPWGFFAYEVWVPSLWLGHLALLISLLFRSAPAGLGAALSYWCMESISRGVLTGKGYLFRASAAWGDSIGGNRLMYLALTVLALTVCLLLIRPVRFRKI